MGFVVRLRCPYTYRPKAFLLFITTVYSAVPITFDKSLLNIPVGEEFDGSKLSEIISLSFSNQGYQISGRKVSRDNVDINPGLSRETGFKST